ETMILFLRNDGKVYLLGYNTTINNLDEVPILIPGFNNITQISSTSLYTIGVRNDGKVLFYGRHSESVGLPVGRSKVPTIIPNLDDVIERIVGLDGYVLDITDHRIIYIKNNERIQLLPQ